LLSSLLRVYSLGGMCDAVTVLNEWSVLEYAVLDLDVIKSTFCMKQADADLCNAPNTIHLMGSKPDLLQTGKGVRITTG